MISIADERPTHETLTDAQIVGFRNWAWRKDQKDLANAALGGNAEALSEILGMLQESWDSLQKENGWM